MKTADIEEKIEISKEEYVELMDRIDFLECLEAAGVDNWDGYDYARELYRNPDN